MTIRLRDYQTNAVEAVHAAHGRGVRRPAGVMATGGGKTPTCAKIAETSRYGVAGGKRVIFLAHREELVEQNAQRMRDVAPDLRVGIVQAGQNQVAAHVISASIQTLANPLRAAQLRDVGLVIYDECHHSASRTGMQVLQHFGCMSDLPPGQGGAVALGVTATMARGDSKALGDIWQEIVFVKDAAELIADGFLVRPHGIRVRVEDLQLGRVRKTAGDYSSKGLGEAIEDSLAPKKIVEAWFEHASGKQTIAFAPLVHTAEVFRDEWRKHGVAAEVVSALTPKDERKRILQDYRDGRVTVLCNAMIFTEGTDLPMTECIVIGRPTMSIVTFLQMIGRGMRLWPGKTSCVVLDVVGATNRHKLATPVDLFGEEPADREDVADETLVEDVDQQEEQDLLDHALGLDELPAYRDGALVSEPVDLFEGSDAGWLRTYAGVWFLATATRYVAVLPRVEGGYAVVAMSRARAGESSWVIEHCSELGYAMAHGTGAIAGEPAQELSAWSARNMAAKLGLIVQRGMTAGEVRKMVTVGLASARIDQRLPGWVRR